MVNMMFFLYPCLFFFMVICMLWSIMNDYSWGGLVVYCDSWIYILLISMSIFILGVVMMSDKNFNIIILSELLVLVSILFFIPSSVLVLYIFFELSMFPILVMILGYGSQIEKINSAYYLIFYASFCSLPFLFIYFNSSLMTLVYFDLSYSWEVVFILSLSFMMKFPVYFLHLWLPKAHVEAPTSASMLLAGLLLKLGTVGFVRIMGCMSFMHVNYWVLLSFLGMILASLSCIFQSDAKSLAAYSSIAHMGFLLMVLLFVFISGKVSGLLMMLAHGYTSTLLFYMVGEFYHISSTRVIYFMNSFLGSSVIMAILFSLVLLSNMGVPPSMSFLSEFMGISLGLISLMMIFFILFGYFFFAFYYSIYFLTNMFMGKNFVDFSLMNMCFTVPLVLMMFNIFWLSLFY
uniref:NADH-ubiquinone oxidoreductase chain 4 n=1 Tax=Gnathostoma nipponicum TaxID=279403 RepID=A0A1S6YGR7_9BILA|nr:NADH dehydrogenase subunit 4 [Gnathostoma nipponicum]AQX44510.1 NADH dehydrogenase subunit 4 [Gnathostoma nipponicum]